MAVWRHRGGGTEPAASTLVHVTSDGPISNENNSLFGPGGERKSIPPKSAPWLPFKMVRVCPERLLGVEPFLECSRRDQKTELADSVFSSAY